MTAGLALTVVAAGLVGWGTIRVQTAGGPTGERVDSPASFVKLSGCWMTCR
jgi:hypothetical protein